MDNMRKAYVMPLPVVDETYKLVGIVTTRDILGAAWLFLRILISQ
ncbi:MAG TPA: CBS domain-containing protein [Candidatus Korarchaeota archaeon]|nr:CBS domain-containing protein [Candidatus Korarchaeota archaeon]